MARSPDHRRRRGGATLVESALILTVLLTLILGMIDLGLGVLQFNTISHAAREGARQAMVHGQLSKSPWPTGTFDASTSNAVTTAIQPALCGCNLSNTNITVTQLDGSNAPEKRVQVVVTTSYQPMITWIFGSIALQLSATSTTRFAH
jgi:Flp pilus assembly protein TadG